MADNPFRVLLDLTDLHVENFKYVWINVSPRELKTISDFKKSVLRKINLEQEAIKLFVRDGLLLDDETIIVLREDDTVKVQYESQFDYFHHNKEESQKEREKSVSRKRTRCESNIDDISVNSKRSKTQFDSLTSNQHETDAEKNNNKKRKKKKSHLLSWDNENNLSSALEQSNDISIKSYKKKNKKSSRTIDHSLTDVNFSKDYDSFFSIDNQVTSADQGKTDLSSKPMISVNCTDNSLSQEKELCHQDEVVNSSELPEINMENKSEVLNNICPKKKRKRRRKRKQTLESTNIDVPDNDGTDWNIASFSKTSGESVKQKHNMYSTSPNIIQEDNCFDNVDQLNLSNSTFVKDKKCTTGAQSSSDYPKISTPAQSNGCDNPNWHVSLMQAKNSVPYNGLDNSKSGHDASNKLVVKKNISKDVGDTKNSDSSTNASRRVVHKPVTKSYLFQSSEESINPSEKQYAALPPVDTIPQVGTHIAYKTLELDENYSPIITDYRKGIVTSINPNTEEIEIELYKELIKPGRTGKFENLKEDEIPSPEIQSHDVIRWSSIISPKYLS